jgi:antitoxin (DNA-binding transcriptional repressor) of toxin-antitoxin stability system
MRGLQSWSYRFDLDIRRPNFYQMKTISITRAARDFNAVIARMESEQEEIVIVRNRKPVARLVPEPAGVSAAEMFGDLCGVLDNGTADALQEAVDSTRTFGRNLQ